MKKSKRIERTLMRSWLRMTGLSVLFALALAACGQASGESSLVVSIAGDPRVFNTNYVFDNYAYYTDRNVYGRLVGLDFASGEPFGDLATEWESSDDYLTHTFKLREGVKWHDGEDFDAEDVVWTYTDVLDTGPAAYSYPHVANVSSVEASDSHTVVFTLEQPDANFAATLGNYYAPIVLAEHIYAGTDAAENQANQHPIGTGPFKFVSQEIGDRVIMERNDDYWGLKPEFDQLVFRVIPNRATAIAALRAGEIAYSTASPAFGDVADLESADSITVDSTVSHLIQWIGFNMENPILADVNVRKAISHAINTEEVNDNAYFGLTVASKGQYLSYSPVYDETALQPAFDVDEAERLLDEAGYPRGADGTRFELNFVAFHASIYGGPEAAAVVQQQLDRVGIKANIDLIDVAIYTQKVHVDRDFDMVTRAGLQGPNPQMFADYVVSTGGTNVMAYSNEVVDQAFIDARTTSDFQQQLTAYHAMQQELANDMPRFNLVEYAYLRPYRTGLSGWGWEANSGGRALQIDMYNGVTGVAGE